MIKNYNENDIKKILDISSSDTIRIFKPLKNIKKDRYTTKINGWEFVS